MRHYKRGNMRLFFYYLVPYLYLDPRIINLDLDPEPWIQKGKMFKWKPSISFSFEDLDISQSWSLPL
jgi:hypothetical protein